MSKLFTALFFKTTTCISIFITVLTQPKYNFFLVDDDLYIFFFYFCKQLVTTCMSEQLYISGIFNEILSKLTLNHNSIMCHHAGTSNSFCSLDCSANEIKKLTLNMCSLNPKTQNVAA